MVFVMMKNSVKEKLRNNKPAIGLMVTTGHPDLAEIYSKCGFDWLYLDTEHGNIGRETLHRMIQAMGSVDCVPFVRVNWNDPVQIKIALDMGALGIIVPQIESKEEAIRAVRSCRYGPTGIRGCSPRRASDYYLRLNEYVKNADEEVMVIPIIESLLGADNIDEILSVKGIDAISIGTWDLSNTMGFVKSIGSPEFPHPKVAEKKEKIVEACKKAGIPVIMGASNGEEANKLIEQGHRFIILGEDIELYQVYVNELSKIKR